MSKSSEQKVGELLTQRGIRRCESQYGARKSDSKGIRANSRVPEVD